MKKTSTKPYFSTTEVAKILGVSRIAIFHKIKKGQLEAERYGRNYLISHEALEKNARASYGRAEKGNRPEHESYHQGIW